MRIKFPDKFLEYIQERGGDVSHTENGEPGLFIPFNLGVTGSEDEEVSNYNHFLHVRVCLEPSEADIFCVIYIFYALHKLLRCYHSLC